MKKLVLFATICALAGQLMAAESDWLTDLPQALAKAKAENKQVLMDFTGSDWCEPCIKLHKNVFESAAFETYAKNNLVLVLVDFPFKKPQSDDLKNANKALALKFDSDGYPTVILLNSDGKVVRKEVGYSNEKADAYVARLAKLKPGA